MIGCCDCNSSMSWLPWQAKSQSFYLQTCLQHHMCTLKTQYAGRVKVGKGSVCDWAEYPFAAWQGEPSCAVYGDDYPGIPHTLEGVVLRESACEIQYGPLNCDMVWRPDNA